MADVMHITKWTRARVIGATFLVLLFGVVIQFVVMPWIDSISNLTTGWWLIISMCLNFLHTIGVVMVVGPYDNLRDWYQHSGGRKSRDKWYVWAFILAWVLLLRMIVVVVFEQLFPGLSWGAEELASALTFDGWFEYVLFGIASIILAPIIEEFFFRGGIQKGLRRKMGKWPAIIISSILFGVFHIVPLQAISAAIMGVALGWLFEKSQSVWPSVVLHALSNGILFVALVIVEILGIAM